MNPRQLDSLNLNRWRTQKFLWEIPSSGWWAVQPRKFLQNSRLLKTQSHAKFVIIRLEKGNHERLALFNQAKSVHVSRMNEIREKVRCKPWMIMELTVVSIFDLILMVVELDHMFLLVMRIRWWWELKDNWWDRSGSVGQLGKWNMMIDMEKHWERLSYHSLDCRDAHMENWSSGWVVLTSIYVRTTSQNTKGCRLFINTSKNLLEIRSRWDMVCESSELHVRWVLQQW